MTLCQVFKQIKVQALRSTARVIFGQDMSIFAGFFFYPTSEIRLNPMGEILKYVLNFQDNS